MRTSSCPTRTSTPIIALALALALAGGALALLAGPVAGAEASTPSAWSRPTLVGPTTVTLSEKNRNLKLNQSRDYVLVCPNGRVDLTWTLIVWGGHNVVLDGCDVNITRTAGGMELKSQTGTMWLHDVHVSGPSLMEGIDLQEPGATVVLRDVLVDTVHGSYATNHADLLQTWAGPSRLLIDGFTGTTNYQGFFLMPNQWYSGPAPTVFDLRNVDIDDTHGAYALWLGDVKGTIGTRNVQNVYVNPNPARTWRGWWLWGIGGQDSNVPGQGTWANVVAGRPSAGSYVRARTGGATGVDENVSPLRLTGE